MATKKESISKKVKELESILQYFEGETIDLDEGIEKYENAMKLAASIKELLTGYEERIKEISTNGNGGNSPEANDPQASLSL